MLIINADDLGCTGAVTDRILACFKLNLLTSASVMVFMGDSIRSAEMAVETGLETGLHLNLTQPFDGPGISSRLRERHQRAARYFRAGKRAVMFYNPLIKRDVEYLVRAQHDEFVRLFRLEPTHFDGHHHMHLSMNVLWGRLLPPQSCVRRNLAFARGEKSIMNRAYRRLTDACLVRRYRTTDAFVSIDREWTPQKLEETVRSAERMDIEMAVHPGDDICFRFLMDPCVRRILMAAPCATHQKTFSRAPGSPAGLVQIHR